MSQDLAAWWAEVLFDRPASDDKPDESSFSDQLLWMAEADNAYGSPVILERIAELHERYVEWTERYSAAQLSQGLWTMFSYPCFYGEDIVGEFAPFDLRARAMRSLVIQYQVYVKGWNPERAMPHGWDMLWDLVIGYKTFSRDLADVALGCLQTILAIDDVRCHSAALHGLNHLDHPERPRIVQRWMDAHRDENWNWAWVEACRDGRAM